METSELNTNYTRPPSKLASYIPESLLRAAMVVGVVLVGCDMSNPTPQKIPTKPAITTSTIIVPTPDQTRKITEEEKLLRANTEKRFGIEIRTLTENMIEEREDLSTVNEYVLATSNSWTKERLEMLAKFLDKLPPHFYQMSSQGKKLRITMGLRNATDNYSNDNIVDLELDDGEFAKVEDASFSILTHELTHYYDYSVNGYTGQDLEKVKENTWYQEIDEILGIADITDFDGKMQPIFHKAVEKTNEIKNMNLDEKSKQKIFAYFVVGYGSSKGKSPTEFVASLSQLYILGKEQFTETLNEFFDPDTTDKLYAFSKQSVFNGAEF